MDPHGSSWTAFSGQLARARRLNCDLIYGWWSENQADWPAHLGGAPHNRWPPRPAARLCRWFNPLFLDRIGGCPNIFVVTTIGAGYANRCRFMLLIHLWFLPARKLANGTFRLVLQTEDIRETR